MALHLCASAGQKTGFGALRKCKSDASDASNASDASYIHSQCVWGGDDDDDDDDDDRTTSVRMQVPSKGR